MAGMFLCEDCQRIITTAEPGDSRYESLRQKCKEFWTAITEQNQHKDFKP